MTPLSPQNKHRHQNPMSEIEKSLHLTITTLPPSSPHPHCNLNPTLKNNTSNHNCKSQLQIANHRCGSISLPSCLDDITLLFSGAHLQNKMTALANGGRSQRAASTFLLLLRPLPNSLVQSGEPHYKMMIHFLQYLMNLKDCSD